MVKTWVGVVSVRVVGRRNEKRRIMVLIFLTQNAHDLQLV
jgi:hypothetical protein